MLCFFPTFYMSCTLPKLFLYKNKSQYNLCTERPAPACIYLVFTRSIWTLKGPQEFQITADCEHFVAGRAGIRYRTFFQKCEFHEAAPHEPSFHLMGALFRIRCCKPGGRCLYPSGPVSPIWIRITLISCWTSAWWSPTWKCGSTSLLNRNRS